ncbi:MAG: glycosyltransferase [Clostridiales bacterium]|nr:glycosyltransferase [Clostridiales bacterium]
MRYKILQKMILPDTQAENYSLYYRHTQGVLHLGKEEGLYLKPGEKVNFLTYFNGFYADTWLRYTTAKNVRFRLFCEGEYRLAFYRGEMKNGTLEKVCLGSIAGDGSDEKGEVIFELPDNSLKERTVIWPEAEGRGQGCFLKSFQAEGETDSEQEVRLAVVLCTFCREREAMAIVERIAMLPEKERPAVFLSDNGSSLMEAEFPDFVRYVPGRNCGGSGGFARGALKALESGEFTHVIFMDDDIWPAEEVILRTRDFLRTLRPALRERPVAGSLLCRDRPWLQYECAARWERGRIRPLSHGLDLRKPEALLGNGREGRPEYGGWWYCCIPLKAVCRQGLPLPLFLHRDDVEYGLRLGAPLTLNGVGVWHPDPLGKNPQAAEYYDVRNLAIVNSVYLEDWSLREWKHTLCRCVGGNLLRGRYEYARLNLLGALDFLKGADYLAAADGEALHQKICARLSPLRPCGEKRRGIFYTTPEVSLYTVAVRRSVAYVDRDGRTLYAKKNPGKAVLCLFLLYKTLKKTDRYFARARGSYRRKWRKMTTGKFWKDYLEKKI